MIRWLAATLLVALTIAASARALEPPKDPPLLSLTGGITNTNEGDAARFDVDMLRDLDWRDITTFTPFTSGPQRFAGPTLSSVLRAAGADGARLRARAINDYSVEIPAGHAAAHGVIVAVEHNGAPMRVRDKGPLWIVYPQGETSAKENGFSSEMIWQLTEIEVLP